MSLPNSHPPADAAPLPDGEGGLRAPANLAGWRKAWWWFHFLVLVKLARLRFIAVLIVIGLVITQWDTLVARYEKWTRHAVGDAQAGSAEFEWFCPMHPSVIRDSPNQKCPICFMPLSKRKKGSGTEEPLPAGIINRVQLSPYRVVLGGIRTWEISYQALTRTIRTVGYVEFNERGERQVSARVGGRIDRLFVNETGRMVKAGDELASLYSPDLFVTVQNLLSAQRSGNQDLLANARTRLELLGIGGDQIDTVLKTGKVDTHLTIRSPIAGHVIKKYVREGQYVQEGSPLFDLVDLSTVWIEAQVYEDDMGFLPDGHGHAGSSMPDANVVVAGTTRSAPGETFRGKLTFVYPHVDQETRTVTARLELDNPYPHRLRPGTTASVAIRIPPQSVPAFVRAASGDATAAAQLREGRLLAVPETAVIDTGRQTIVYRESLPGVYDGIDVKLGPRMTGSDDVPFFPVMAGLAAGDRVVTAGSFLVDAETRLNPAAGSIYFGNESRGAASAPSAIRSPASDEADATVRANLAKLSAADQALAEKQVFCAVLEESRLGSMGVPIKLALDGEPVFLCCPGCRKSAVTNAKAILEKLHKRRPPVRIERREPAGGRQNAAGEGETSR